MIERFQTIIIILAVGIGLVLGQVSFIEGIADSVILPFLLVMLYGFFLSVPLANMKKAMTNRTFALANIGINFVFTPILAWGLGAVFLSDHPALWIGLIMLLVTPCTDWYLAFTSIAKGNLALSTAILPLNFLLQMIVLPLYLFGFAGITETVKISVLLESIVLVLAFPFLLALLTKYVCRKSRKEDVLQDKLIPLFENLQSLFLNLAIIAMFASQGRYLLENMHIALLLLVPVVLFFLINFFISRFVSKSLRMPYEDSASLTLTVLARNSPISLAIAVTAFPDQPLIALALVIGPLIELPVLAIVSNVLLRMRGKQTVENGINE